MEGFGIGFELPVEINYGVRNHGRNAGLLCYLRDAVSPLDDMLSRAYTVSTVVSYKRKLESKDMPLSAMAPWLTK